MSRENSNNLPEPKGHKREKWLYLITAALLCIAVTIAAVWDLYSSQQQLLETERRQSESTTFLLSEWISGAFREVDHATRTLAAKVKASDFDLANTNTTRHQEIQAFLKEQYATLPHAGEMAYTAHQCILTHAVRNKVGLDVSFREYCAAMRDFPEREQYISKLIWGTLKQFATVYIRRVRDQEGNSIGYASTVLKLSFFQQWLDRVHPRRLNTISITDRKGRLLAQTPSVKKSLGKEIPDPIFQDLLSQGADKVHFVEHTPADGKARLIYFSKVPELPFMVMVTSDQDALLAPWYNKTIGYLIAWMMIVGLSAITVRKHFKALDQATELYALAQWEQHKNEEQSRFLAMLGHELKTPLAVVRMVLGSKRPTPALIQKAERSIDEMDCIIITSQEVGRMESGVVQLKQAECSLNQILDEITAAVHTTIPVQLSAQHSKVILSDCTLLRIILSNLIDNAAKYGDPERPIEITLSDIKEAGGVELSIANHPGAVGWPDRERIFEKYYRSPEAHRYSGSGLGLYLITGLTTMIGGHLRYQPTEEQICFRLNLPETLQISEYD